MSTQVRFPSNSEDIPVWSKGKAAGRGELARELLESVRAEEDGRLILNVNATKLREVAKL